TDTVYQQAPYSARPNRDTRNATDGIYTQAGANVSRVLMTPTQSSNGYTGTLNIGVNLAAGTVSTTSFVLPQIAYGAGWQTSILLSNNNDTDASAQINFHSESGDALSAPLGSSPVTSWTAALAARTTNVLDLVSNGTLTQGWADLSLATGV